MIGSSLRLFGMSLIVLFLSLFQFATFKPAVAMTAIGATSPFIVSLFSHDDPVTMSGADHAQNPQLHGVDPKDPAPPYALKKNPATSVFHRLRPGIVMVPRMNRTPRPKSVYRCFTRAPGGRREVNA